MRPRLLTFGILILVTAVVLVGVTGCERKAESREPVATETVEAPSSGEPSEGGQQSPMPGETIVSAVTPAGGQTSQPGTQVTSAPAGGTPVVSGPTATTAPPATSPDTGDYVWHTVQRGETAYSIAVRYGTTVNAIASANGLANPSQIYAGQKLKIPTSGSGSVPPSSGSPGGCRIRHTVQAGEWVYQIARNYGVSPQSIVTANGLANPSLITPGMVLCIP
jgi:LysM repeat protein